MTVDELLARQKPRRKVQGITAALLPYEADGRVAVEAFSQLLVSTHSVGLLNSVNMDTGYVNYLSDTERQQVLSWTRQALGKGIPFVAGAYIENLGGGDIVALYRQQIDAIVRFDGIPILFQTARLQGKSPAEMGKVYRDICSNYPHVLAFELGSMFAPNGEIWNSETVTRLMDIPEIKGMKHSSLNRLLELERLALRDAPPRLSYLHRKRSGNQYDRIRIGLFAGACRLCAGEIRRARSALGGRRSRVLRCFRRPAVPGKCCLSRSRSRVQTFRRSVPKSDRTDSHRSDTLPESTAFRLGGRNHGGLCSPIVSALSGLIRDRAPLAFQLFPHSI